MEGAFKSYTEKEILSLSPALCVVVEGQAPIAHASSFISLSTPSHCCIAHLCLRNQLQSEATIFPFRYLLFGAALDLSLVFLHHLQTWGSLRFLCYETFYVHLEFVMTDTKAGDVGQERKDDSPEKQNQVPVEDFADVPDPDEDDLDDLDGMYP